MNIWAIRGLVDHQSSYHETLSWIRECTFLDDIDQKGYDFHTFVDTKFRLVYDQGFGIATPLVVEDEQAVMKMIDFKALKALHAHNNFLMLAHITSDEINSFEKAVQSLEWMTLEESDGLTYLVRSNGEKIEKGGEAISPFLISYKLPGVDIYNLLVNTDLVNVSLNEFDINEPDDTFLVVARGESYRSVIDRLFEPSIHIEGGSRVDNQVFLTQDGVASLHLLEGVAGYEGVVTPEHFKIDTNLETQWVDNVLSFKLNDLACGYLHVYLDTAELSTNHLMQDKPGFSFDKFLSKWEQPRFSYSVFKI